jgi:gluconate 5-dehydrogenase
MRGLDVVSPCDLVLIHDGVRPFVTKETVTAVLEAAAAHGAAGCVAPLVDTVIMPGTDGFLDRVLRRSELAASQTPQAFRYEVIRAAYRQASAEELAHGTECLSLALAVGVRAKLVPGAPELWKVTYPHDLWAAEAAIRLRSRETALVAGGTSGIGREVARQLAAHGVRVAVLGRCAERLEAVASEVRGLAIQCDVSQATQVEKAFADALGAFGRLDIVVNGAAIAELATVADTADAQWRNMVEVNLSGSFYVLREALRIMQRQRAGVIVNVLSSSIQGGRPEQGGYAATKAGLLALTETAALEARSYGVDVFGVAPERTNTPLRRKLYPHEDPGDLLPPSRVAEVITFCCLQRLSPLSGQVFWVRRS